MAYPFKRARNLPRTKGTKPRPKTTGMNAGELAYSQTLDDLMARGVVAGWWYELLSVRLADNTFYRPDFVVLFADGTLELHEVKPRKKGKDGKPDSYWAEEDAQLKMKVVAEHTPIPLVVVWPMKGGGWATKRFAV